MVQLVLFIASSGISGAIGNAFHDFLRRLSSRERRSGSASVDIRPIAREEAVEHAKWRLLSHYVAHADGLDLGPQQEENLEVVSELEDKEWAAEPRS